MSAPKKETDDDDVAVADVDVVVVLVVAVAVAVAVLVAVRGKEGPAKSAIEAKRPVRSVEEDTSFPESTSSSAEENCENTMADVGIGVDAYASAEQGQCSTVQTAQVFGR